MQTNTKIINYSEDTQNIEKLKSLPGGLQGNIVEVRKKVEGVFLNSGYEQFKQMETPEIIIKEEKGVQLFSILLKAIKIHNGNFNEDYNNEDELLIQRKVNEYFIKNPLENAILKSFEELSDIGINNEYMYNIALAYNNKKRTKEILYIAKNKIGLQNPEEILNKFFNLIQKIDEIYNKSNLNEIFSLYSEKDIEKRNNNLTKTNIIVQNIINFFKPDSKNLNIKNVYFIPTDPLLKNNYGRAFGSFENEHIILSHVDNNLNQEHEFLHSIINPIISLIYETLSNEEKNKILINADDNIKNLYGDNVITLLRESFVIIYTEYFSKKRNIGENNKLGYLIFNIFNDYGNILKSNPNNINFQQYIQKNFQKYLELIK